MILAIDPGSTESAYMQMALGLPFHFEKVDNDRMLNSIECGSYSILVIEEIQSFGMSVGKEVFNTSRWTGRFEERALRMGRQVVFVGRQEVKLYWCGSPRAKDPNVRQALIDYYGPPGTKKAPGVTYGIKKDIWSALAIAGYWYAKQQGRA